MSSTNRGAKRLANDCYQTPQWCVDLLAKRTTDLAVQYARDSGVIIVDAGAGDGRIGQTILRGMLRKSQPAVNHQTRLYYIEKDKRWAGEGTDLSSGLADYKIADYPEWLYNWDFEDYRPALIVSNPPFSQSESFVMGTLTWLKGRTTAMPSFAVFLLRLNWLASRRRADFLNQNPPSRITALAPRPSFKKEKHLGKDGKMKTSSNDSCEYAWVWWKVLGSDELRRTLGSTSPMTPHFEVAVREE